MTRSYFDGLYARRGPDQSVPPAYRFAGANLRLPEGATSVLDVGCGEGEFLASLGDRYRTVGVDSSFVALRRAGGLRVQGSAHQLPFADRAFDLVSCFEVLEHVSEPTLPGALAELERVSRQYIAVSVPNREVLEEAMVRCCVCGCVFHASRHVRMFDESALGGLFPQFRMVECRSCGPTARYGGSPVSKALIALARRRPPALVACPQCEYAEPPVDRVRQRGTMDMSEQVTRILWSVVQPILFRARRPYWLLALYVRR